MTGLQNMLAPFGPIAGWEAWLWWVLFWVSVVVYAATTAPLFYAVLKGRRAAAPANENARVKTAVIGWATGASALILLTLVGVSAAVGSRISDLHAIEGIPISLNAQQWWWEVVYPNPDPSLTITTANEIHIPARTKVKIDLRSSDVIHSFWVPNLAGKRDLIPGRVNLTWIQADRPGTYRGQCAEFCGYQHAHMSFLVVAHEPEEFQLWLAQQRQATGEPADDMQRKGRQVFQSRACILCHTISGAQAYGTVGPNLNHFGSRQTIGAATLPNTPEKLGEWIVDSQRFKPGNRMPPLDLPPEEVGPLVAYLESLK